MVGMKKVESLHTFAMNAAFDHEDEGTAVMSATSVKNVVEHANSAFPGLISSHQLARSLDAILIPRGFRRDRTLLATSLCCDEVCRELEDELRNYYGQNFAFGGIGGFPFGGATAVGALGHHVSPVGGNVIILFGSHVGIDLDGVIGRINRSGHQGSGSCCNTAQVSLAYVKAVKEGHVIHSPDASDPIDAQQVFVDSALIEHTDRLLSAEDPQQELAHAIYDCQEKLMFRLLEKCLPGDFPPNCKIALVGGVQVNTPDGTADYFLPRTFALLNNEGEVQEDLLGRLIDEGHRDLMRIAHKKKQLHG